MTYVWLVLGSFFTGIIKDKQNILSLCSFVFWHMNRILVNIPTRGNLFKMFLTATTYVRAFFADHLKIWEIGHPKPLRMLSALKEGVT